MSKHDVVPIKEFSQAVLRENVRVIEALPVDDVAKFVSRVDAVRRRGAHVYLAGNGGSAATASHMTCDLMKAAGANGQPAVKAMCLSDCVPAITAIANDEDFGEIFSRQLSVHGSAGDLLIAVSGSGRSPNVLRALVTARGLGIETLGLLGMGGGEALRLCDVAVVVDSYDYEIIENAHMAVAHLMSARLRDYPEYLDMAKGLDTRFSAASLPDRVDASS